MVTGQGSIRQVLVCGAAVTAFISTVPAFGAQANSAPATSSPGQGEIVVTAQRRTERLEDVPMSVAVLNVETVSNSGVVNIHDIGELVPGAQIQNVGFYTQPAIRGVTTLTAGTGYENNVAIYVDGFYTPDMISIDQDLVNIDNVQVLKGPQGALWGRNATGGAILINTKAPDDHFTGKVEARYARFDDKIGSAYISGPISEKIRFNVMAYGRRGDGYNKMLDTTGKVIGNASPVTRVTVRTKLEADLTDNLEATLAYNYGRIRDPRGGLYKIVRFPSPALPEPPERADQPYTYSNNHKSDNLVVVNEGTLKLALTMPVGTLTSYTGYGNRKSNVVFDFDATWLDYFFGDQRWEQKTFQQAIDFSLNSIDNLDLIIGASYYNDKPKNVRSSAYSGNNLLYTSYVYLKKEAYAAYLDATYALTDKLSLNAGGRYTHEKSGIRFSRELASGALSPDWTESEKSFSAFTPRASIRYEIADRTNIYASYSKGFRSGGFQNSVSTTSTIPFSPEKIDAFEIGFKTAGSNLRLDMAAFYYDYRNLQVGQTIPNPACAGETGCAPLNLVSNAPKAEIYGAEAAISASPAENLDINLGVSVLHARYKDFANATATGWSAETGLNLPGQVQDWSGQQMTRAPDFTANMGIQYTIPDVGGGSLLLAGNASYTSSFVVQNPSLWGPNAGPELANRQRYRQPHYALINAQIKWTDPSEHFEIGVFGNNLTDKRYYLTFSGSSYGDWATEQTPRTYGVRVGYSW